MIIRHEFDVERRSREIDLHEGPMGSGKTGEVIAIGEKLVQFSKYGVFVAQHIGDKKSGDKVLGSRRGLKLAAERVQDAGGLYCKVIEADKKKFRRVVIIGEAFFYDWGLLSTLHRFAHEGRAIIVDSLARNAKGESIPLIDAIKNIKGTEVHQHTAYCQVADNGVPCSNVATDSLKLYPTEGGAFEFCYGQQVVRKSFERAPFWSRTIEPQDKENPYDVEDGEAFYIAACPEHFHVPGREETQSVIDMLKKKRGGASKRELGIEGNPTNLNEILAFLSNPAEGRGVTYNSDLALYTFTGPR